jgi:flagellar hook assembly protein FlgD
MGREVRTLMDRVQSKGYYDLEWNGESDHGEFVSTGVYFLQFTSNGFSKENKMILLK